MAHNKGRKKDITQPSGEGTRTNPLMAFVDECKMAVNFWLRSGDAYTTNNFLSFLEDTLSRLEGELISLLRADSGFYSQEIFAIGGDITRSGNQGRLRFLNNGFYHVLWVIFNDQRSWADWRGVTPGSFWKPWSPGSC